MLTCEDCGVTDESVTETTYPVGLTAPGYVIEEDVTLCGGCHYESWSYV